MRLVRRLWRFIGQVLGEGEYHRYCQHLRVHHPSVQPPSPKEYYRTRLEEKYSRPNRCC